MANNEKDQRNQKQVKKIITKTDEDLELKKQLLLSPNLLIPEKGSDEGLDKLSLKIKLIGGKEFTLEDYVVDNLIKYESKFFKDWYYELAKLYGEDKKVMDQYHKPKFVALFKIQFIYGRFPYLVLRTLRKKSPFILPGIRKNKLFQYLTKDASEKLDVIIEQSFAIMKNSKTVLDFKLEYSKQYKIYFQIDLFA